MFFVDQILVEYFLVCGRKSIFEQITKFQLLNVDIEFVKSFSVILEARRSSDSSQTSPDYSRQNSESITENPDSKFVLTRHKSPNYFFDHITKNIFGQPTSINYCSDPKICDFKVSKF